jgi:hypothetical protein
MNRTMCAMLREERNIGVEELTLVRDRSSGTLLLLQDAEAACELNRHLLGSAEARLRVALAKLKIAKQRRVPEPSQFDHLFDPFGNARDDDQLKRDRARTIQEAGRRVEVSRSSIADAAARLRAAEEHLAGPRSRLYRFHFKRFVTDVPEDRYRSLKHAQGHEPVLLTTWDGQFVWWYLDRFWWDNNGLSADAVQASILDREANGKQPSAQPARAETVVEETVVTPGETDPARGPISEEVMHQVWRRDQGRCVDCGSHENLELNHIIPLAQGGASSVRNLELRCETCSRRRSAHHPPSPVTRPLAGANSA